MAVGKQAFMDVFNTLAPVFFIIALGAILRSSGFMSARMTEWSSGLTYWVALPALLFFETSDVEFGFLQYADVFLVLLGGTVASMTAGYLAAWMMRLPVARTGALVQAAFRGNLAFIGIPVVVYGLGEGNSAAVKLAVLVVAAMLPINNALAILVLIDGEHRFGIRAMGLVLKRVAANPLILSCLAGLAVAGMGWQLPLAAARTLEPLGNMALPLALINIGSTLNLRLVTGSLTPIMTASLIKVALGPLAGYGLARLAGLGGDELRVALIMLACPTASSSFVMAAYMGRDTLLTAGAVVMSTLLSFISLFMILWI